MFTIQQMSKNNEQYNSIRGGTLNSKFSIHARLGGYKATSANGNIELIEFLDNLSYLSNKTDDGSYTWWDIDPQKIILLQNEVMNNFSS